MILAAAKSRGMGSAAIANPITTQAIYGQISPQQAGNEILSQGGSMQDLIDFANYVYSILNTASKGQLKTAAGYAEFYGGAIAQQPFLTALYTFPLSAADLATANTITTQALTGLITPAAAISKLRALGLDLQEHNYVNYVMGIQGNPTPAEKLIAYAFANDINDYNSLYQLAVMYQYNTGSANYVGKDPSRGYSAGWASAMVSAKQAAAVATHQADPTWLDTNTPAIVAAEKIVGGVLIGLESGGVGVGAGAIIGAVTGTVISSMPTLNPPTISTAAPGLHNLVAPPASVKPPAAAPAGNSSSVLFWIALALGGGYAWKKSHE